MKVKIKNEVEFPIPVEIEGKIYNVNSFTRKELNDLLYSNISSQLNKTEEEKQDKQN